MVGKTLETIVENAEYFDLNYFVEVVQRDGGSCDDQSVPEQSVLSKIIQTAFSVSCLLEEGRSLSFRICSFDVNNCPPSVYGFGTKIFRFREPVLYNTTNLKKLALSANPDRTMICVSSMVINGKDDLYISAIFFFLSNYEDLSLGNALSGYVFPSVLNILVCRPGCLVACCGNNTLHTYVSGKIVTTRKDLFDLPVFYKVINKTQRIINEDVPANSITTTPIFKNYLKTLITFISKNNHGGSLLIIPDGFDYSKTLDIKYKLDNNDLHDFLVKESFIISSRASNQVSNDEKTSSIMYEIKQYVSTIADFASVDGALVINYSGNVIGYGAEILHNSPSQLNVYFVSPEKMKMKKSILEYGTRHRSVCRLVKKNEDIICFIFSQDGGIKACFNDGGDVYVYTDIENELESKNAKVDYLEM